MLFDDNCQKDLLQIPGYHPGRELAAGARGSIVHQNGSRCQAISDNDSRVPISHLIDLILPICFGCDIRRVKTLFSFPKVGFVVERTAKNLQPVICAGSCSKR